MSDRKGILEGIKVVEVSTYVFAPAAGTVLSDFGAEVIKVELPGIGDHYRYLYKVRPLPSSEINYCWILHGRNKKSVAIDLKKEAGRDLVHEMVKSADVFLTNYHPSVLEQLGLRYEDLAPLNEGLIYAHGTGFGEKGEDVENPGYDATAYWARSGLMDCLLPVSGDPGVFPAAAGDNPSAIALFSAIMLGLYDRKTTGRGTKVSTSLLANGAWANSIGIQAALCGCDGYERKPRAEAANPLVNYYRTRDAKTFLLCCVRADKDWAPLARAIERPVLVEDPRLSDPVQRQGHMAEVVAILDEAFAEKDMAQWKKIFEAADITYSMVATQNEAAADPQIRANGILIDFEHPVHGPMQTVDSPISLRGIEKTPPTAAPEIGQHTAEVLGAMGYDDAKIQALVDGGVVEVAPISAK